MLKYTGILLDNSVDIYGTRFSLDAIHQLQRDINSGKLNVAGGFTVHQATVEQDGTNIMLRALLYEVSIIPGAKSK